MKLTCVKCKEEMTVVSNLQTIDEEGHPGLMYPKFVFTSLEFECSKCHQAVELTLVNPITIGEF